MKNAMTFDDIYLSRDSAVKLVLKEIDVMDLEYAFFSRLKKLRDKYKDAQSGHGRRMSPTTP